MKSRSDPFYAWVAACAFAAAGLWPLFTRAAFPLRALRNLTERPALAWPLAGVALALALFLSAGRLHTRRRLLACAVFSIAFGVAVFVLASMVVAPPLLLLGVQLWRENRAGDGDAGSRPA